MNKNLFGLSLTALTLLAGTALAGGADRVMPIPKPMPHSYACDNGEWVGVRYVESGGVNFVVVRHQALDYGLAPAVSASGSRFVGLSGMNTATGLEWWEHQGEGTLSSYDPQTGETDAIVTGCRLR